jgi:hypothetical protein
MQNRWDTTLQNTSTAGKKRAAIVVNDKHIDAILRSQISDENATIIEARVGSATLVIASMYFDLKRLIDQDLKKCKR